MARMISRPAVLLSPLAMIVVAAAVMALAPAPVAATKYNITKILAPYKEYSKFNDMLSKTRLAYDINRRQTITVLAVDNSAMSALDHYSLQTIRHILELHVLVDYYGDKKLKKLAHGSTASSSMFQATGSASGMSGYVNITRKDGKVSFMTEDADDTAKPSRYVKSVKEFPYDIAVLQVSSIISSAEAEAPVPPPAPVDLEELLSKRYCKSFASLLSANAEVFRAVNETKDNGLTLFCPVDSAVAAFAATYKNLTAKAKAAILLYHAVPDYFSLQLLKSNNGMVTTLATASDKKMDYSYDVKNKGETVTLQTRVVTSSVTATVGDMEPLAVYAVNKFLQPKELFKVVEAPAPAPEPSKKKKAGRGGSDDDSSDDSGDSTADAEKGDAAPALLVRWLVTAVATAGVAYALMG
ncbi:fasciclin-like arabinogalactan protein 2 [Zea mays]|uniref:Fasciclin-like arabinogalactan protein 2 n=1 Tax=Zea mays TaxID=4577 RepID=B6SZA0_MAIZE|nr:fasciclin-like arabinogalactan protein 2 [Zea mays]ACG30183.1 fasciclin-like arabinogalactan protein 8 precursor [Zea mays]ACN27414.1 unknown [Zea mays]ONM54044.1 Fasciclin-like arabinogalactan protein 2 [Zea mays]|eukprot:XP_008651121.1 fasciclin-like arabinogalactan protein 2 [Zea mays]